MKTRIAITSLALLLCFATARAAGSPKKVTFRVLASMSQYGQPASLGQLYPSLFYLNSAFQTLLTITPAGVLTPIFTAPSSYVMGYVPITAPNGRSYSVYGGSGTTYQFSIKTTSGSLKTYPASSAGAGFVQSLPNGELLGIGSYYSTGASYLATGTENGAVKSVCLFPQYQAVFSPIYASDGNYYGVAWAYSGTLSGSSYVFKVTPAGVFTQLVQLPNESFTTGNGGAFFQANDGNFYGTTSGANAAGGIGTLYQVTPSGQYSLVYSFGLGSSATPGLALQGSDGNFYGVTQGVGGPVTAGEIFELTKSTNQYISLHRMEGDSGACPCWLMQGSNGILYGTAGGGGKYGGARCSPWMSARRRRSA
jgi:uncharacterized repeat protein (TIGR03803 family)